MHTTIFLAALAFLQVQGWSLENTRQLIQEKGMDAKALHTIGGRLYYIGTEVKPGSDSFLFCADLGMVMASLETEEEELMIAAYMDQNGIPKTYYWLSAGFKDDIWRWNGSGQKMVYTNWNDNTVQYNDSSTCVYTNVGEYWTEISGYAAPVKAFCEQTC